MNDDSNSKDRDEVQNHSTEFMSRSYLAEQNILKWLSRLDLQVQSGDAEAIRMFHSISCAMVERLNQLNISYASSVLEWPILLPQDRDKRKIVTESALRMRIGSVKAGGPGGVENLEYDSEKGFAIQNLRRMSFIRAILAPIPAAYDYDSTINECSLLEDVMRDSKAFSEETELINFDEALLKKIQQLKIYSEHTREEWISVIADVLKKNEHLVPAKFRDSKCREETYIVKSRHDDADEKGKTFTHKDWKGGGLKSALRGGLKNVTRVPGFWGQ